MGINLIAACGENGVIGFRGSLPWRLPADMAFFKQKTMGCPVIMGRKTYESIGRPLPNRTNIVVTASGRLNRGGEYPEATLVAPNPEEALRLAPRPPSVDVWIIGGNSIYRAFLEMADRIVLTEVLASPEGDVWFPEFSEEDWELEQFTSGYDPKGYLLSDPKTLGLSYAIKEYTRKKKRSQDGHEEDV